MRECNSWSVFREGKVAFKRRVGLKIFAKKNAPVRFFIKNQAFLYRNIRVE